MTPAQAAQLAELRQAVDAADEQLLQALAARARAVAGVWAWKQREGVDRVDPGRETAMRARLLARAEALGLDAPAVERVLGQVIGKSLAR